MSSPPQKKKLSTGAEVLQAIFENGQSPLSDQFLRWKLWSRWRDVVGASIADQAEPVGFQRGVLHVWVKSSTWMQHFSFMKAAMVKTINEKFQQNFIKDIRFTLDRKSVPQENSEQLKEVLNRLVFDPDNESKP